MSQVSTETRQSIVTFLHGLTPHELDFAIQKAQEVHTMSFSVGDKVQFEGRGGQVLTGTIIRRNAKSASVKVENGPGGPFPIPCSKEPRRRP